MSHGAHSGTVRPGRQRRASPWNGLSGTSTSMTGPPPAAARDGDAARRSRRGRGAARDGGGGGTDGDATGRSKTF